MSLFRFLLTVVCLISGFGAWTEDKVPEYNNFWQAAAKADEIGIVKSGKHGKDLKITGLLSVKKTDANLNFPVWTIWQLRASGDYLIPLSKKDAGYEISGRNYRIPAMEPGNTAKYKELIEQYKKLKPEEENAFLKKVSREDSTDPGNTTKRTRWLAGYLHNWEESSVGGYLPLNMVPDDYDIIHIAFVEIAADGTVSFKDGGNTLPIVTKEWIREKIDKGKIVTFSAGGANASVILDSPEKVQKFANSFISIIEQIWS
ncbi:MAG: glycosyl hydrolase family 18 protein [Victivallaceae bacterium]|nr:glycosyl hydrolase family 18 protein [Victivallaceae bacterium]